VLYFYLTAAGIAFAALIFVVYPIIRQQRSATAIQSSKGKDDEAVELSNASVIKQRISELEREVDEGLIGAKDKENAIKDLKLALVDEMPNQPQGQQNVKTLTLVLLALPAIVIGAWVYWQSNQLNGLQEYKQSALEVKDLRKKLEEQGPQSLTPNDFAKFALSIRSNLRDNPDDARGWSYLAMVNTSIGRVEEGIAAYKRALDLTPQDDQVRFKYAEALMFQGTEQSFLNARRQLEYLISKDPQDRNNRLLLTSVAIQLGDAALAVNQFRMIKGAMNPSSQFYQSIVAELKKLGVNDVSIVGEVNASVDSPQNTVVDTNSTGNEPNLLINVNVSPKIANQLPDQAYLIVFAQHSDQRSRAPLAVKRINLPTLPITISLSDSDAMIPAMNLSSAQIVKISARVSLDADVMVSPGEFEGSVNDIDLSQYSGGQIELVIDTKL
jgi:cytochrome c-type biogenesis protein CcmI